MSSYILKTVLLGLISTGVFASECQDWELSFRGFMAMKKSVIPEITSETANSVFTDLEKRLNYEDRFLETLGNEKLKILREQVEKQKQQDFDLLNHARTYCFFNHLKNKDFKNAYLLKTEDSKIKSHSFFEQMQPIFLEYSEELKSIKEKLDHFIPETGEAENLLNSGDIDKAIESFDLILAKIYSLISQDLSQDSLEKYTFEEALHRLYHHKWSFIIKRSNGFFSNTEEKEFLVAEKLYNAIFDEFIHHSLEHPLLYLHQESHIPLFFYAMGYEDKLFCWIDKIFWGHFSMKEGSLFSLKEAASICTIQKLYEYMKSDEGMKKIDPFYQAVFKKYGNIFKNPDFLGVLNKNIDKVKCFRAQRKIEEMIDEDMEKGRLLLEEGKIKDSWYAYEVLIEKLKIYNDDKPSFKIKNLDDHIQRIKKIRWILFTQLGQTLFIQKDYQYLPPIYTYLFDDFKNSTQDEKNKFYVSLFLDDFFLPLSFYGANDECRKLKEWTGLVLDICSGGKERELLPQEIHAVLTIQALSSFRGDKETLKKNKFLYEKACKQDPQMVDKAYKQCFEYIPLAGGLKEFIKAENERTVREFSQDHFEKVKVTTHIANKKKKKKVSKNKIFAQDDKKTSLIINTSKKIDYEALIKELQENPILKNRFALLEINDHRCAFMFQEERDAFKNQLLKEFEFLSEEEKFDLMPLISKLDDDFIEKLFPQEPMRKTIEAIADDTLIISPPIYVHLLDQNAVMIGETWVPIGNYNPKIAKPSGPGINQDTKGFNWGRFNEEKKKTEYIFYPLIVLSASLEIKEKG